MNGRPTRLDDLVTKRICDAIAKGLPRRTAAKLAGVAPSSLFLWLRKGRDGDVSYSDFSERVAAAEAKGEEELMGYMRDHAKASASACQWLLERRNPAAYGRRPVAEAAPPGAEGRFASMSDAQLEEARRKIRQQTEEGLTAEEIASECSRLNARLQKLGA